MATLSAITDRRIWRLLLAFVFGALLTLGFAPFGFLAAGILSFGGLLWLLERTDTQPKAFWTGWFFGWGHFIAGLYWIASAFLVEPEKFAWMIPLPTLGLPALLAVFPALAVMAAVWIAAPGPWRVLALAACWTLMEMARSTVLTGFPWNLVGYIAHISTEASQPAAWVGIYGLSFLAVLGLSTFGMLVYRRRHLPFTLSVTALIALTIFVAQSRLPSTVSQEGQFTARIVQGNIAQRDKWHPDHIIPNFRHLLGMSTRQSEDDAFDVVIWPETAATFRLEDEPNIRRALGSTLVGARADGSDGLLVTGAPRSGRVGGALKFFNSAHVIDQNGEILATADKHYLVPLGEYLPFRSVLQVIGLDKLAQGRGDFSPGSSEQVLRLPDLPDAALLICYEAIFPSRAMRETRPGWILNLTNDGWFGNLTGPDQHFMMTRFRAIEQGLPLVRAAGTGISGVIDPYGRVTAHLNLNSQGKISTRIPLPLDPTMFSRIGSAPVLGFCLILVVLLFARRRKQKVTQG